MSDFMERHGSGKVFRWGFSVLAVLLVALVWLRCADQMRYTFEGERLTFKRLTEDAVVMVDRDGNEATLAGAPDLFMGGGANTLTYLGRTIRCTVDWDDSGNYLYSFSDGTSKIEPLVKISFSYAEGDLDDGYTPLQRAEFGLMNKMQAYFYDGHPIWNHVRGALIALIVLLIGMALFCFPETAWKLQTMFIVRDGEPTEWALFSNRLAGVLLVAFSFIIPFLW